VFHVNLVITLENYEHLVLLYPPSKFTWPDYKDGFYYHSGRITRMQFHGIKTLLINGHHFIFF